MNASLVSRIQSLWSTLKVEARHIQRSIFSLYGFIHKSASSLVIVMKTKTVEWYKDVLNRDTAVKAVVKQFITPEVVISKLKRSCLAHVVMSYLGSVGAGIRLVLLLSYTAITSLFLGLKCQAKKIPERLFKNTSYIFGALVALFSVSYMVFVISANWGVYSERDILANQDIKATNGQAAGIEEELLSRVGASDNDTPPISGNIVSQSTASMEDHEESQKVGFQDSDKIELDSLLLLIKNIAGLDKNALEIRAKTEVEFLNILEQSPQLIHPLLNSFVQLPEGKSKDLLRSLLATTGSLEIEHRAIEQVSLGDATNRADWLALLRDTGIQTLDGRNSLLEQLTNLNQPEELSNALLAFSPQIVSASQRQDIIDQLSPYLNHTDDIVRNAAVESLSRWADSDQSYILEQALTDSSDRVRQAAVFAAFTSTIKSDYIKTILLGIMRDDNESWPLRMDAHNALTGYTLQGQEYDEFFQFHQEQTKNINIREVRG